MPRNYCPHISYLLCSNDYLYRAWTSLYLISWLKCLKTCMHTSRHGFLLLLLLLLILIEFENRGEGKETSVIFADLEQFSKMEVMSFFMNLNFIWWKKKKKKKRDITQHFKGVTIHSAHDSIHEPGFMIRFMSLVSWFQLDPLENPKEKL